VVLATLKGMNAGRPRPPHRIGVWIAGCLLLGTLAGAAAEPPIRYTVTPILERDSLAALAIEVRFTGEADGETQLELPDTWGGESELYRGIRDLTIAGGHATLADGDRPAARTIRHAPGAALTVRYRVVQFWEGAPTIRGRNEYRPVIQPGYFHVIGHAVFVRPAAGNSAPATFELKGLPPGWRFASDLEHQHADRPLMLGDVFQSIMVGGDYRVVTRGKLRVAFIGTWRFQDQAFIDRLQPIVASHQRFFGDPDEPFLVTVLPLKGSEGQISIGGTGLDDAFAFFASANAADSTLTRTLAHEHLHTWIPRRIGRMPMRDEASDYWLSEGFTDFYTFRLLVRAGFWSVDQYAAEASDALRTYATSSVRTAPNARVVAEFWKSPEMQKVPYQRGFLLASLWDARLQAATKGARDLDDVILAMRADARADTHTMMASHLFAKHMGRFGVDVTDDIARYIERGEAIVLPADLYGPGARIVTTEMPEFSRGFDIEKTSASGNVVTGLDPDSPAYRAGLRDGMKILARTSGRTGDSRVPLTYRVQDGDAERVITYAPEGRRRVTLQELVLDPALDEDGRRALAKRLGGE